MVCILRNNNKKCLKNILKKKKKKKKHISQIKKNFSINFEDFADRFVAELGVYVGLFGNRIVVSLLKLVLQLAII